MNVFSKFLLVGALILTPIVACKTSFTGEPLPPGQELDITAQDQVTPDLDPTLFSVVPFEAVPDEVEVALQSNPTNPVVITAKENLVPNSTRSIPLENVDLLSDEGFAEFMSNPSVMALLTGLLGGIQGAAPYLLGLEVLLGIIFKRKRENYAHAGKSIVKGNLSDSLSSLAKGYGIKHTDAV